MKNSQKKYCYCSTLIVYGMNAHVKPYCHGLSVSSNNIVCMEDDVVVLIWQGELVAHK